MIANISNSLRPIVSRAVAVAAGSPTPNGANILRILYFGVSLASLLHIWEVWGLWLASLAAVFVVAHAKKHQSRVTLCHRLIGLFLSATTALCLTAHFDHMIKELLQLNLSLLQAWLVAFIAIEILELGIETSLPKH
jgi:hypothetical protein